MGRKRQFTISPDALFADAIGIQQRLGLESMRRFDACSLCLQRAREPVACAEGHLYCKECVYSDLLAQKKDIKRHQARLEEAAKEEEEERNRARESARERVLKDFEKSQLGLAGGPRETEKEAALATSNKSTADGESMISLI
jgi:nitric oxide synthase-interacting protein